jgi:uncharacterized protein DUF2281
MAQQTKSLEQLIRELPEDLRQDVYTYVQSLLDKRTTKRTHTFKFDWRGGLKDLRDQFTSVELQHDMLNDWDKDESS